jgi:ribosomal protein S27AE
MQINIRCFSCHTPFSVKTDEVESALLKIHEEGLKHYNALCPRCGKSNKVSKAQLKRAAPGWKNPKK